MSRYLVDTNVFLYARGGDHPLRAPCRAVLRAARDRVITLEASVELVQEYAHVLLRRSGDRAAALEEVAEVRSQCHVHPLGLEVLGEAWRLLRGHPALGVRDAVHAATAVRAGIERIVSADRCFDALEDVTRVDPATPGSEWQPAGA